MAWELDEEKEPIWRKYNRKSKIKILTPHQIFSTLRISSAQ